MIATGIVVVRFSDGEDVLGGIAGICRSEEIRAACFNVVGGMKSGHYVVGPETEEMPRIPVWREAVLDNSAVKSQFLGSAAPNFSSALTPERRQ